MRRAPHVCPRALSAGAFFGVCCTLRVVYILWDHEQPVWTRCPRDDGSRLHFPHIPRDMPNAFVHATLSDHVILLHHERSKPSNPYRKSVV